VFTLYKTSGTVESVCDWLDHFWKADAMILTAAYDDVQVSIPDSAYSLDGFRRWAASSDFPEHGRFTLFDGEVFVDMSPERIGTHNQVKAEITFTLEGIRREDDLGVLYPDGLWLTNDAAGLSTEADATFVTRDTIESGRVKFVPCDDGDSIEMCGSPDWVLEVVSPSSVRKDTVTLLDAYFQAGVIEYWPVDARGDEIQFTVFRRDHEQFIAVEAQAGWLASSVFAREFRLERSLDSAGGFDYTLHVRGK
jgi:Uma2 family endonuclease